ncbi:hypothetical protein Mal15_08680 [Stieleria maiorica]|uniref:Uncharacterized protein n=1 Tax=Stieleria maiorica TaxID=2795974 RepID=A0A5B9M6L6_9BACT|nr:hypothetical protein Mal15_08680 [Stieleria maiorica]
MGLGGGLTVESVVSEDAERFSAPESATEPVSDRPQPGLVANTQSSTEGSKQAMPSRNRLFIEGAEENGIG